MKIRLNMQFSDLNRLLTGLVLLLTAAAPLAAQSKYAGESFSVGVGARGLGLGSAYHTLAEGAEALYWNPAGLVRGEGTRLNRAVFMHSERFGGDVDYNFLGWSHRLAGNGPATAFGFGLIHLGVGGIPITALPDPTQEPGPDNRPYIERYSSKNDFALLAGAGRQLDEKTWLGANVKLLHERQWGATATGFGFDLGLIRRVDYRLPLLVSLSARDVTTSFLAWSTGKREYIKPWISAGAALAEGLAVPGGRVNAALEVSIPVERRKANYSSGEAYYMSLLHLGAEYELYRRLALRAGLDERNPTFGAGLTVRALSLDYAWIGHRDLAQTQRVSLGYSF